MTDFEPGNCRKCGIRTHESRHTGRLLKRLELIPLTNEHVLSGRCLLCHPLPPSVRVGAAARADAAVVAPTAPLPSAPAAAEGPGPGDHHQITARYPPCPPVCDRDCSLSYNRLNFNADGSVMSRAQIVSARERRGLCTTCDDNPTICYDVSRVLGVMNQLRPLTNDHVLNGRCLRCKPLVDHHRRPPKTVVSSSGDPQPAKESRAFQRDSKRLPGGSYEGQLNSDGGREGHGTMRYTNGEVYVGGWKEDLKEGQGLYGYADGSEYDGHWRSGKKEGTGTFRYSDGDCYVGQWQDDVKHGQGTYAYSNGGEYVGPWKADKKHGCGVTRYANGEEYRGEYAANRKHGKGTYLFSDGSFHISRYKDGSLVGEGVQVTSDREVAWRLRDGELAGTIPLQEARVISARVGIPLPMTDLPSPLPSKSHSSPCPQPRPCPQSITVPGAVPATSAKPNCAGVIERIRFQQGLPGFTNYLLVGGEVGLCVAIDFTAAKGDPRSLGAPHHIAPQEKFDNDYEAAIRAVQSVPCGYCPTGAKVPVWGFGAKFDGSKVEQVFQCGQEKEVPLQDILQAYQSVLKCPISRSGPADFTGVIQAASEFATGQLNSALQHSGKLSYSVLIVLTVNDIKDVRSMQRVLATASAAPLSVVIVGIGDGDFGNMGCLDEPRERKNAQFVRFQGQRDATRLRPALLLEEALERIQSQLLEYFG